MTRIGHYRIYPAWRGFDGDYASAIAELAHGSAHQMDCQVRGISVTGHGFDRRGGHYRDFTVIYVSESVTQRSTR